MLDPVYNQDLRLCLGSFITPIECFYIDAHEPILGARRAKLYVLYASKSLPERLAHDAVFDNKHMKLFQARLFCPSN